MFFTNLYEAITDKEREELLKTLFLNTDTEFCAQAREEYYKKTLKHLGQNVRIGTGVKVVNKPIPPYSIAVGVPAKVIKKREF